MKICLTHYFKIQGVQLSMLHSLREAPTRAWQCVFGSVAFSRWALDIFLNTCMGDLRIFHPLSTLWRYFGQDSNLLLQSFVEFVRSTEKDVYSRPASIWRFHAMHRLGNFKTAVFGRYACSCDEMCVVHAIRQRGGQGFSDELILYEHVRWLIWCFFVLNDYS
eukprot:TRINITY_DN7432_c0_g1_i3.p1 TRINITY_DN7432_c0_g1~~TRINITY_DN7432_c0_g1_i3.p1  ORF type:complete len:163 (+),score=9.97 TRINITY_DN7432_c0_g1_i3:560-1048(+)